MYIRFNDREEYYEISVYRQIGNFVMIRGKDLPTDNESGFKIFQGNKMIGDFSDYTKKYNVLTTAQDAIFLTDREDCVETEQDRVDKYLYVPAPENIKEDIDPLTNEELTECVADLMYEMSAATLGI